MVAVQYLSFNAGRGEVLAGTAGDFHWRGGGAKEDGELEKEEETIILYGE